MLCSNLCNNWAYSRSRDYSASGLNWLLNPSVPYYRNVRELLLVDSGPWEALNQTNHSESRSGCTPNDHSGNWGSLESKLNSKTVHVLHSLDPSLIFPFHLLPSSVHLARFPFWFFPGFFVIFILSSNNNNKTFFFCKRVVFWG